MTKAVPDIQHACDMPARTVHDIATGVEWGLRGAGSAAGGLSMPHRSVSHGRTVWDEAA